MSFGPLPVAGGVCPNEESENCTPFSGPTAEAGIIAQRLHFQHRHGLLLRSGQVALLSETAQGRYAYMHKITPTHTHTDRYIHAYMSVCLSVCLSACQSVYLPIYLSIYLSTVLSICLSMN